MTIRAGESGKEYYIGTYIDLSQYTELEIHLKSPSGQVKVVNTADGVQAPNVDSPILPANPPSFDGGSFLANTYLFYVISSGDFDVEGNWTVCATYINRSVSPEERYMGASFIQKVEEMC